MFNAKIIPSCDIIIYAESILTAYALNKYEIYDTEFVLI